MKSSSESLKRTAFGPTKLLRGCGLSLITLLVFRAPADAFEIRYTVSGEFTNVRPVGGGPGPVDPFGLEGAQFTLTLSIDSETAPNHTFIAGPQINTTYFDLMTAPVFTV